MKIWAYDRYKRRYKKIYVGENQCIYCFEEQGYEQYDWKCKGCFEYCAKCDGNAYNFDGKFKKCECEDGWITQES